MSPIQGGGGGGVGGGGAWTLIGSDVLAAPATSLSVSSIPNTHNHLVVVAMLRSSDAAASDNAFVQFNGDTAVTYYYDDISRLNDTTYSPVANAAAFGGIFVGTTTAASSAASVFSPIHIWVPLYAKAVVKSCTFANGTMAGAFSAANMNVYHGAGWWNRTAAITEVAVVPGTGPDFATLSGLYVYGVT